jgi:hypothetical protein
VHATQSDQEKWLAIVVAAALDHDVLGPADVLRFITPEVLASHLPPDVMSALLGASLEAGQMTAEVILRAVGPAMLARYVPPDLLWSAVRDAARRADLPTTH